MSEVAGSDDRARGDLSGPRCAAWREIASAELDGEATADEVAALDVHLADCAGCRAASERMALATRAARLRPAEDDVDLVGRVLDALDAGVTPFQPRTPCDEKLHLVGVATCGCAPTCPCGCQDGQACRCGNHSAA